MKVATYYISNIKHTNLIVFVQLVTYEVWKNRLGGHSSSPEKGPVETQVLAILPISDVFKTLDLQT